MACFIDPVALLRNLSKLETLRVAAYCQRCYRAGLDDRVAVSLARDRHEWVARCQCSTYPPIVDPGDNRTLECRQTLADGTTKVHRLYSVDELFRVLGWGFRCTGDCAKLGMHDGVEGNNDPRAQILRVSCGCTDRVYPVPA